MNAKQNYKWNELTMGTCYYPEHWDKKLWADDLDRMKKTGISVIRIAEFAWSKVEPEEGVFTYDFFDEFLDLCSEKQMKVIFGTPTATPPAWLTEKYPEVLNARKDGVLLRHGGRRHYNYNSPVYQRLCARVVERKLLIMRNIRQSWDGRLIMKSTVKWMSFIQRQILLRFVNFSENSMELWRN